MLKNAYLDAKFRFDTDENEPKKEPCVVIKWPWWSDSESAAITDLPRKNAEIWALAAGCVGCDAHSDRTSGLCKRFFIAFLSDFVDELFSTRLKI